MTFRRAILLIAFAVIVPIILPGTTAGAVHDAEPAAANAGEFKHWISIAPAGILKSAKPRQLPRLILRKTETNVFVFGGGAFYGLHSCERINP
jgi:hypothetical protein